MDEWSTFTTELFTRPNPPRNPVDSDKQKQKQEARKLQRIKELVRAGELSKAYRLLTSTSAIATIDDNTLEALKVLHPQRLTPDSEIYYNHPSDDFKARYAKHHIKADKMISLLKTAGNMVTPGLDGLRYEHLRMLVGASELPAEVEIGNLFAQLLTLIANGTIPQEISRYFASSALFPLAVNPTKIRPIIFGFTLRALASKYIQHSDAIKARCAAMEHIQKGANVKNGVEKVIHSTKCGLSMYSNYHILATDFRNAFNSLDRALLLERVETDSPTMYPLVHALYSAPADLWVSGTSTEGVQSRRIQSSTGSQQGCVHGAHAFNEGSHPTLLHIKSILADDPNSNINAYVDDHT
jgi:hypothetical protein